MSSFQRNIFQKKLREAEASLGLNFNEDDDEVSFNRESLPSLAATNNQYQSTPQQFNTTKTHDKELPSWQQFFQLNKVYNFEKQGIEFQTYYQPPSTQTSPIFICHHGAGSSALTFAMFTKEIRRIMNEQAINNQGEQAGVFCFDARGHGNTLANNDEIVDFSIEAFVQDFCWIVKEFFRKETENITSKNPIYLLGHSLGGSIVTKASYFLKDIPQLKGIAMLDIVEETAIKSLNGMYHYLNTLPRQFDSIQDAIDWHINTGLVRDRQSAEISIPPLIIQDKSTNKYRWVLDLRKTEKYWNDWFVSLSSQFISTPFTKLLVLAGTDNLDKDLMIGQMQGKYQLVVFQESGHFVQEDCASRLAWTIMEFWQRNSASSDVAGIKTNWGKKK